MVKERDPGNDPLSAVVPVDCVVNIDDIVFGEDGVGYFVWRSFLRFRRGVFGVALCVYRFV